MTYPGLSMWNGSSKIHYFIDFWHSLCCRLWRPWMILLTKSKGDNYNLGNMLKAIIGFQIHQNLFKCWFTFRHFDMEHPVDYSTTHLTISHDMYLQLGDDSDHPNNVLINGHNTGLNLSCLVMMHLKNKSALFLVCR